MEEHTLADYSKIYQLTDIVLLKKKTYFGLKLHALVTTNGFVTNFILTAANIDDRDVVFNLIESNNFIKIIGDKRYVSNILESSQSKEKEVLLISLKRKNSKYKFSKQLPTF